MKFFGAEGDGVTDDSEAVQATFDAIDSGGIVYFPSGEYHLEDSILAESPCVMMGAGTKSTLLDVDHNGQYGIRFTESCVLRDLGLTNNGETWRAVSIRSVDGALVDNILIDDWKRTGGGVNGIRIRDGCENITVRSSTIRDLSSSSEDACRAINFADSGVNGKVIDCNIIDIKGEFDSDGIDMGDGWNQISVSDSKFKNCDRRHIKGRGTDLSVDNCLFIQDEPPTDPDDFQSVCEIRHGTLSDSRFRVDHIPSFRSVISVRGDGTSVKGCTINLLENSGSTDAIDLASASNVTISGIVIDMEAGRDGIRINDGRNISVGDVSISNCPSNAINIRSDVTGEVSVSGCTLREIEDSAIFVSGGDTVVVDSCAISTGSSSGVVDNTPDGTEIVIGDIATTEL